MDFAYFRLADSEGRVSSEKKIKSRLQAEARLPKNKSGHESKTHALVTAKEARRFGLRVPKRSRPVSVNGQKHHLVRVKPKQMEALRAKTGSRRRRGRLVKLPVELHKRAGGTHCRAFVEPKSEEPGLAEPVSLNPTLIHEWTDWEREQQILARIADQARLALQTVPVGQTQALYNNIAGQFRNNLAPVLIDRYNGLVHAAEIRQEIEDALFFIRNG
jgi:hypothetical protein